MMVGGGGGGGGDWMEILCAFDVNHPGKKKSTLKIFKKNKKTPTDEMMVVMRTWQNSLACSQTYVPTEAIQK